MKLNQSGAVETRMTEIVTLSKAMHYTRYNQSAMAKLLGMNRTTLTRRLECGDEYLLKVIRDKAGYVVDLDWINKRVENN